MLAFSRGWDPLKEITYLTGRVVLITGGNAWIGLEITKTLATHGAKVYMGARSKERAKEAIGRIKRAHLEVRNNGNLIWLPLDLTYPADVVRSAKDFMAREKRLEILSWAS
ncbi:MAG: hypothetical protein Q9187_005240, partial [Circinaria calcarea]